MPEGTACAGAIFYSSGLREGGGAASTGAYCPGGTPSTSFSRWREQRPMAGGRKRAARGGGVRMPGGFRDARWGGAVGDCGCRRERRCRVWLCGGFLLRNTQPAGVYLELGNIRNPRDQQRLVLENNRQALANWIAQAIVADYKAEK